MVKLYHSSPYPFSSATLEPRTTHREINGSTKPFVFASDSLQESLTYAVPKGTRLMNTEFPNGQQVLFLDTEAKIGDPALEGGIYTFESSGFEQVMFDDGPSHQWVSADPVKLDGAQYQRINSINDIMKSGVQILQVGEHTDFTADTLHDLHGDNFYEAIEKLVAEEKIRWLNKERDICPQTPFGNKRQNDLPSLPSSQPSLDYSR